MNSKNIVLSGLARRLVSDDLLEEEQAKTAVEGATKNKVPFPIYLVNQGTIGAKVIANAAAHEFGVPLMDLAALSPTTFPSGLVDQKLIKKH